MQWRASASKVKAKAASLGVTISRGDVETEQGRTSPASLLGSFLKDKMLEAKLTVQHELGLGKTPNVIPPTEVNICGPPRTVRLGWHPVAGPVGKWLAEQTRLGKRITEEIHTLPDPTQHWAVILGDYVHQLWMDEHLDIIYINEKFNPDGWRTFEVGKTRFNDEAVRQTGEMVIFNMRQKRPAYNLISNNCQNYALNLLDQIRIGKHREFATTFSIYQRAIGMCRIKDLLLANHPDEKPETADQDAEIRMGHDDSLRIAQQVMDRNTTQLDNHHLTRLAV